MPDKFIFKTENLLVRKLTIDDVEAFHEMQSNPLVMQYATGNVKSFSEHKKELKELIEKYDLVDNDFWIYAIEHKLDNHFVGTCALVKDGEEDEIGYRFLQKYWGKGFGTEICIGLIDYCKKNGFKRLIGYVVDVNIASTKILEKLNFTAIKKQLAEDLNLPETKYELKL